MFFNDVLCLVMQGYKGVVFCPTSVVVPVGKYDVPNSVVYAIPAPYETHLPHTLDISSWSIKSGNDGTFGFVKQNMTVRRVSACLLLPGSHVLVHVSCRTRFLVLLLHLTRASCPAHIPSSFKRVDERVDVALCQSL